MTPYSVGDNRREPRGFFIRSNFIISDEDSDSDFYYTTRPTAVSGAYGIIDGDGNIQRIESTSIVDEDNNILYNPVTNTSYGITDWTYNYDDRAYQITADDGSAVWVTYGDDSVTIVEPGGTYNVYYVEELPVPTPTPTPAHVHSYTEATVIREPSCTVPGARLYTCEDCGYTYQEEIPVSGHVWEVRRRVATEYDDAGNLMQEGYTIYHCSVCGEEYKDTSGTAPPGGGATGGGGSSGGDSGGGGILSKLGALLGTIANIPLQILGGVVGTLLDGLISLAESIGDKLSSLVEMILGWFDVIPSLFSGFLLFLGAMFQFFRRRSSHFCRLGLPPLYSSVSLKLCGGEYMVDVALLFGAVVRIFQIEIIIYDFTFSLWQVFLFSSFAGVLAWILRQVFLGD